MAKPVRFACSSPLMPDSAWITDLTASARRTYIPPYPVTDACYESRTESSRTGILVDCYLTESAAKRKALFLKSEHNWRVAAFPLGPRRSGPKGHPYGGRERERGRSRARQDRPRKRCEGFKLKSAEFTAHFLRCRFCRNIVLQACYLREFAVKRPEDDLHPATLQTRNAA